MSWQVATGIVLGVAVALAILRGGRRNPRDGWVWLQLPAAALLYLVLYPPVPSWRADALTVLTPGATRAQSGSAPEDQRVVALPGTQAPAGADSAPDLATALRAHSGVRDLLIIGGGLTARDRSAVQDRALEFDAAPARGLVQLQTPAVVPLGREWRLSGRTAAPVRHVELRDPGGAVVDAEDVDRGGAFTLSAPARAPGSARFQLRLLGDSGVRVDAISVPIVVTGGAAFRVIVRAGAINPELKYFRRWAEDTGITTSVAAALSEGVAVRDQDTHLDAAALASADVVIIDARGWAGLEAAEKSALVEAVEHGLGLLLRADAPLATETAADWAAFGFRVTATETPRSVTLDRRFGLRDRTAFTMAAVAVDAPGSAVLLAADDATPLLWWQARGGGRVGLSRLIDSYRLVLLGDADRYGDFWARTLEKLSRPRAPAPPAPRLPTNIWVFERAVFCGLGAAANVNATEDDPDIALTVTAAGCAGYWPATAGWQTLRTNGASWPFYVRAADDGASLRASLDRQATLDLGTSVAPAPRKWLPSPPPLARSSRWPWFGAWLILMTVIWWRERRGFLTATELTDIP